MSTGDESTHEWLPDQTQPPEAAGATVDERDTIGASPSPTSGTQEPIARQLGRFGLIEQLGSGSLGKVWRAVHVKLDKPVAVKILDAESMTNQVAVERFRQDIRLISRISHPNIVRFENAGETDGIHFLAMELIEGQSFEQLARQVGPLPTAEACQLIGQTAVGLEFAWRVGLIHRDVKPSNLMLTTSGTVKILDFGSTRLTEFKDLNLVNGGRLTRTLEYLAPEQAVVDQEVDIRADIYSLGCILFRLLAGGPPYSRGFNNSPERIIRAHAFAPIPRLRDRLENVPRELDQLVTSMLAKTPDDRPQTPAEVVNSLLPLAAESDVLEWMRTIGMETLEPADESSLTCSAEYLRAIFQPVSSQAVHDEPAANPSSTSSSGDSPSGLPSNATALGALLRQPAALIAGTIAAMVLAVIVLLCFVSYMFRS